MSSIVFVLVGLVFCAVIAIGSMVVISTRSVESTEPVAPDVQPSAVVQRSFLEAVEAAKAPEPLSHVRPGELEWRCNVAKQMTSGELPVMDWRYTG